MFKKKYLIIPLLLLIITIGAISQVSASDIDANDGIITDDASIEEVSTGEIIDNGGGSPVLTDGETDTGDSNTEVTAGDESSSTGDESSSAGETVATGTTSVSTPKKVKISAAKLTTIYKSNKKFKVKVLDSDKKAVSGLNLKIKVYTGKKYKTYKVKTNSKGIAYLKVSSLKLGKHKVVVSTNNALYTGSASSSIKINPRPVTYKVISIKNKEFAALYVTVKDKTLKKYVDGIPVKLMIYTGKKAKTYRLATSYDKDEKQHGALAYITNALTVGKHKVKLVAYGNYKGTKTSKITLLKSAKKNPQLYAYTKKGKMLVYVKYKGKWIRAQ